jgi:S1-C subfamily serine protease
MKNLFKKIITIFCCLVLLTGCDLSDIIKNLIGATSSSSQQIGSNNVGACKVYSDLSVLIEEESVSVLSSKTELQKVFDKVDEATFMVTACYIVDGTRYERVASGFIIKKEVYEDAYKYYLVSNASKLFYRNVDNSKNVIVDRTPEYVEIVLGDYKRYYAQVEKYYDRLDVVVLSIITKDELSVLEFGDSDSLIFGDTVYSMGTPAVGVTLLNTMNKGNISNLNVNSDLYFNDIEIASYTTHQFDAPINTGMEGGPVFLEDGKVVGILTYRFGEANEYESLSRFIPINDVKNCLEAFTSDKDYSIPTVGIQVMDLYNAVARNVVSWTDTAKIYEGCYVESVVAGSVSANAGIPGDSVIVGAYLNDEYFEVNGMSMIFVLLSRYKEGDTLKFEVRDRQTTKVYTVFGD